MRRRDFIKVVVGSTAVWPFTARAQQPTLPAIGFLNSASPKPWENYVAGFRTGLKDVGYVDGQNVTIEFRWAEGHYDRLPDMAADLVRRKVNVLVATGATQASWPPRQPLRPFLLFLRPVSTRSGTASSPALAIPGAT